MSSEIAQAAAAWHGSVDEINEKIKESRGTIYAIETKLRMHIPPAYLGDDAARKLLGSLLAGLEAVKIKLAIYEAETAAANLAVNALCEGVNYADEQDEQHHERDE